MIINLRGTNGSGKSTVARGLMEGKKFTMGELVSYKTAKGRDAAVHGYLADDKSLVIVGKYETACGGCDGIKTQDLVCEAVKSAAGMAKHVFFEGVLVSTLFSRYLKLSNELVNSSSGTFVWAYLDTPLDVCLARIQKRNGGKAINEKLVADKVRSIEATRAKASNAMELLTTIDHKNAVKQVQLIMKRNAV